MKHALIVSTLLLLAACSAGSKPAAELYGLRASQPEVAACRNGSSIKIYEPTASPHLDSQRIVVLDHGNKQTFYRGVRWTAPTARMVQLYLADTFERSRIFKTVLTDDSTSKTRWILESTLQDFHIDREAGELVIRLSAVLVNAETRDPAMSVPLEARRAITGLPLAGIIEQFNDGMHELSNLLLTQLRQRTGCR